MCAAGRSVVKLFRVVPQRGGVPAGMAPPDPSAHVGPLPSAQVTSLDASVPLGTPLGSHHAPLSWGYPAWNTPVSAMPGGMSGIAPGPGPRVSVKRALSESEDCDDAFSEDSASKE